MEIAVIRKVRDGDAAAVRELVTSVLAEYGLAPDPAGVDSDLLDPVASYSVPGAHFWVLEATDGAILGTCALYPLAERSVELRKMYLAPSLRGRGWGRRLLEHAVATARGDGAGRIQLETASVLVEAIGLYRRYGFTRLERDPQAKRCDQAWALELRS